MSTVFFSLSLTKVDFFFITSNLFRTFYTFVYLFIIIVSHFNFDIATISATIPYFPVWFFHSIYGLVVVLKVATILIGY